MPEARLAKLARPSTEGLLRRGRLFARLDETRGMPMLWLAAPPGAGKTSLVSSWIEERGLPCLWYQVDAGDADPATFFYYLGIAVAGRLGREVTPPPLFTIDFAEDLEGFTRRWFRDLFAQVPESFVLVFDNYQEVAEASALQAIVVEAASQAPRGMQVIAISRFEPPACFAKLRAARRLAEVDRIDLQLTADEAAAMAEELGIPPSVNLAMVHEQVTGWAAGLVLLAESLRRAPASVTMASDVQLDAIFDYFAALIFDETPADNRDMLMRMAVLPRMSASMAQVITGRPEAAKVLDSLARRNLFVARRPGAETIYEFHALFRAFLRARALHELSRIEHQRLTASAAALLETTGQVEDALALFSETGSWDAFTDLVRAQAPEYIRQGRRQTLHDWIVQLPPARIEADARLLYWLGVTSTAPRPVAARDLLARAFAGFADVGDRAGQLMAAAQIADAFYRDSENWRPLDLWIERIESLLESSGWDLSGEPAVRAAASLLRARLYRSPQTRATLDLVHRLLEHLDAIADPDVLLDTGNALIACLWWRGDADSVERLIARLQPLVDSGRPGPRTRSIHLWWSGLHAVQLVETDRAMALLERGRILVDDSGLAPLSHEFERVQIVPLIQAGRFTAALAKLEQCILPYLEGAPLHLRMGYYLNCAQCHLGLGDAERALDLIKRAEAMCDSTANVLYQTLVWPMVGRVFIALHRPAEARAVFEQMLAVLGEHGSPWLRGVARVGIAHALLIEGDAAGARSLLRAGLSELSRTRYFWNATVFSTYDPTLLAEALRNDIEPDYVRHVVRHRGIGCLEPDLACWPWAVRLHALGAWRVDLQGAPVRSNGGKTGHRLSDLLKALVAYGPDPIDVRLLADALWPDSEADAGVNSLQVAVYRLRKWLRREDVLVVTDGTLRLDPGFCWVDAWAFDRIVERLRKLDPFDPTWESQAREALALYRGALFARELTQGWMLAPREQRHRGLMWLATRLGDHLERCAAVGDAIQLYERVLDIEPVAEELYRRLMACHSRIGNRTEALDTYRRCREHLAVALSVTPSGETERLHLALRAGG